MREEQGKRWVSEHVELEKKHESGGKKLKKNEGLFSKKLISRDFLDVKEAYPSPSFVYYIHQKKINT